MKVCWLKFDIWMADNYNMKKALYDMQNLWLWKLEICWYAMLNVWIKDLVVCLEDIEFEVDDFIS